MSPFDPSKPSKPSNPQPAQPAPAPPTPGGVKVIVRHRTPREPSQAAERAARGPKVVIRPPIQAELERRARLEALCAEHGDFILELLTARRDVLEESRKDLRQLVLVALCERFEKKDPPENVRAYLRGIVHNQVGHHKAEWRPGGASDDELDEELSPATGPEEKAARAEQRAKLSHYLTFLSPEEAAEVRCIDLEGMTIAETAARLKLRPGTVATQHARAKAKLDELARASERATALGERPRG